MAVTSHPGCRCCRPTSATPTRPAPTGTCTPPPNCSPRPPAGSAPHRENPGDRDRRDHAGILHRAADRPAPGQPAHHRRLPRHLAAAARLPRPAHPNLTLPPPHPPPAPPPLHHL